MVKARSISVFLFLGVVAAALPGIGCSSPATGGGEEDDDDKSKNEEPVEPKESSSSSQQTSSSTTGNPPSGPACGGWTVEDPGCQTCMESQCCSQGSACYENTECRTLLECIIACTSDGCIDGCVSAKPAGVSDLNAFTGCVFEGACAAACSPPTQGIGDTCSTNSECISGTCSGSWCTEPCWKGNSLCAATSQSLANEFGEFNWCVETTAADTYCFPGCYYDSDCAPYGSGASCLYTYDVEGYEVGVCSF